MSKTEYPRRKHPRLKQFDYDTNAGYFVTICTYQKQMLLSRITVGRGLAPAVCSLTAVGQIVEAELLSLPTRFPDLVIDHYVIMANHIHAIFAINAAPAGASPRPTLMDMVCAFKSLCTRRCKQSTDLTHLWQTSFFEHIIRNERDYQNIWQYIENNPSRWAEDQYYSD